MMNKKYNIWLLDSKNNISMYAVKGLSEWGDANIHTLSATDKNRNKYSRYVKSYARLPEDENMWLEFIKDKLAATKNNLIIPIAEHETLFLIKHKEALSKYATLAETSEADMYKTAIDKGRLAEFLLKNNIAHPKSWRCQNAEDWNNLPQDFKGKVLIKPVRGEGGIGITEHDSISEAQLYMNDNKVNKNNGFVVQEYINGGALSYVALCKNGEVIEEVTYQGLATSRVRFSPDRGKKFYEDADNAKISRQLIKAFNWSGVICINLYRDFNTGKIYILEINARYCGTLAGVLIKNTNLPLMAAYQALGLEYTRTQKHYGNYAPLFLAVKHFFKSFKDKDITTFNFWSETPLRYWLSDPVLALVVFCDKVFCRIKNIIK